MRWNINQSNLMWSKIFTKQVSSHEKALHMNRSRQHSDRPVLEIFIVTWNEAHILPYTVRFYQSRFPLGKVQITVYDNESTDNTNQLARRLGCRVRSMVTNQSFSDRAHMDIKNEAWKGSAADWVMMLDADEWVDVWPQDLAVYATNNVTAVKTKGVYLVWPVDTRDLSENPRGVWDSKSWDSSHKIPPLHLYNKPALFFRTAFTDIQTAPGGHTATTRGRVKWLSETSTPPPRLYHAKYFDVATTLARSKEYGMRMSEDNKKHGWSLRYNGMSLVLIARQFDFLRQVSKPLPWRVF